MISQNRLKICLVSSELSPLAKSGGLAAVCTALAVYLDGRGHDLRVLIPFYSTIDTCELDIEPVEDLQDLRLTTGSRELSYAIDSTSLPGSRLKVYLLRCDELYRRDDMYSGEDEYLRFAFLSRVAIEMCQKLAFSPDIF